MEQHHDTPDAEALAIVGRATIDAMRQRSRISKLFRNEKVELRKTLEGLLREVNNVQLTNWTEEDFADTDEMFVRVIECLERYQTTECDQDLALCAFIGSSVKTLREARYWIAQGFSPDPQRRPSDAELKKLAEERASSLRDLFV